MANFSEMLQSKPSFAMVALFVAMVQLSQKVVVSEQRDHDKLCRFIIYSRID